MAFVPLVLYLYDAGNAIGHSDVRGVLEKDTGKRKNGTRRGDRDDAPPVDIAVWTVVFLCGISTTSPSRIGTIVFLCVIAISA